MKVTRHPQLQRAREFLRELFLRDAGFKLLALLLAVSAWAWVQGRQELERTVRVELHWLLPPELALAEEVPDGLLVTVAGSQYRVRNLPQSALSMDVDLTDAEPGKRIVDFQERGVQGLPGGVRVLGFEPSVVEIRLDQKVDRQVRVVVKTINQVPRDARLVSVSVQPETVELEGAASLLADVDQVQTSEVDLSSFHESGERRVQLTGIPPLVRWLDEQPIRVRVEVESLVTERRLEGVQVFPQNGWQASAGTVAVTLEGPASLLDELSPEDLSVVVALPEPADEKVYEASLDSSGARLLVRHPHAERISVRAVEPPSIRVEWKGNEAAGAAPRAGTPQEKEP